MSDARLYPGASSYPDRHGRRRWRYRKGGIACPLPGQPGDAEFDEAYAAAVAGKPLPARQIKAHQRPARVTALARAFSASALQGAKYRAALKEVPFAISLDDIDRLMAEQRYACAITGISFLTPRPEKAFRPSLDRISPAQGYVAGNVRVVCMIVNLALSNWGEGPLNRMVDCIAKKRLANPLANQRG